METLLMRFPEQAGGVNIPELAHLIRVLGGEDALNLDGGGSTTLWLSGASDKIRFTRVPITNLSVFQH